MKRTTYTTARAYCVAYLDLMSKIVETVEVARDCKQMSGNNRMSEAYNKYPPAKPGGISYAGEALCYQPLLMRRWYGLTSA